MRFLNLTGNCTGGTYSRAKRTTLTLISIDGVSKKLLTNTCRTLLINDMSNVLISEVTKCRENGVRSGLSKSAERCALDVVGKLLESVEVLKLTVTCDDLVKDLKKSLSTDTARSTLTAGLVNCEVKEEASKVNPELRRRRGNLGGFLWKRPTR